jgi:ATP phosphoribosyltransferase regulatory subunit HisZ
MSNPTPPSPPTPLTEAELKALDDAATGFTILAEQLAEMELTKPRLLRALAVAREKKDSLMEAVRSTRGLHPGANFEIDPQTGVIRIL